jgi:hypothetical protein
MLQASATGHDLSLQLVLCMTPYPLYIFYSSRTPPRDIAKRSWRSQVVARAVRDLAPMSHCLVVKWSDLMQAP